MMHSGAADLLSSGNGYRSNNNNQHNDNHYHNVKYSSAILTNNGCHYFMSAGVSDNQYHHNNHHQQHHHHHHHHHEDYDHDRHHPRSHDNLISFPNWPEMSIFNSGSNHHTNNHPDQRNFNQGQALSPMHQNQNQRYKNVYSKSQVITTTSDAQPCVHQHGARKPVRFWSIANCNIHDDGSGGVSVGIGVGGIGENNNSNIHNSNNNNNNNNTSARSHHHQMNHQRPNEKERQQWQRNIESTPSTPRRQPPSYRNEHESHTFEDTTGFYTYRETHYQHYYNYHYNRQANFSENNRKATTPRKLPDPNTFMMSSNKKQSVSTELNGVSNQKSNNDNAYRFPNQNSSSNHRSNSIDDQYHHYPHEMGRQTGQHVLKEKMPNNNIVSKYDEKGQMGDHNIEISKTAYVEDSIKFRMENELHDSAFVSPASPSITPVDNKNVCDMLEEKMAMRQAAGEAQSTVRQAKLPVTPKKTKTEDESFTVKKSPAPGHRVLIYSQSPRLSRYAGVRLQDWRGTPSSTRAERFRKLYKHGLIHSKNKDTSTAQESVGDNDEDDSRASDQNVDSLVKCHSTRTEVNIVGKKITLGGQSSKNNNENNIDKNDCNITKTNNNNNNVNSNYNDNYNDDDDDDDDDDEVDDDLDNVSDFDSDISGSSSDTEDNYRAHAFKFAQTLEKNMRSKTESSVSANLMPSNCDESLKNPKSLLAPSLFPNVPPFLAFSSNTQRGPEVPADLYRILKWRVSNVMPKVVRHVLTNSGMRLLKKTNEWMGVWGKHLKAPCFKTIRAYQKFNHLPGSFKIGRKDSLWKNLERQMDRYGKREFGFMPKTFIFPSDVDQLRKSWPKYAARNVKWIIKPPASARGTGIRVVSKWAQIPKRKSVIVQKYIEKPFLINGSKFDLRLYVLVTSINPLRVYLYKDGLARFASVKYSDRNDTLSDRCMHLTNYSINKFSSNYAKNEDVNACHGHKWTLKSLWTYLSTRGIRTDCLWEALRSLILRTILSGESSIHNMIKMNVESKYSVFELFGFDVLLDADLIPWLLEVNISPSLHSELPLDSHVKAPLVQAVLNTALYNIPPKLSLERQKDIASRMSYPVGPICYDKRLYINYLSRTEKIKHNTFTRKTLETREEYLDSILEKLTPDDVRCLIVAEDELARSSPLERIFPSDQTYKYLKYYETPRYYNRLLDAWETRYNKNREAGIERLRMFCSEKYHLQVPQAPVKKYFEDDDTVYYSPPEQVIESNSTANNANPTANTGLYHQISEMDIKIIIAAIIFVTIASVTLCAISYILVRIT